ncbi:multicomponent Na+:H+ antiporter subunit A [Sinobaca qinghaiensis]|uniref:Multicomponent Na+:H+ antiporter subunit A n=1 Tax=Sinobaca qinghaiensis TaxID=342944 RepID=A0A419V508_9BACL|nr:Na+/H+ antiporter subunit A [Sinobaca qinghaiensis]RKD73456.1 multicomponent Na+:H+ antiporter subunit A [Sinobaca qinghaiensis]
MSWLHSVVLLPFLYALMIPFLYRYVSRIHTGWFVLPLPLILFVVLGSWLVDISEGETMLYTLSWIPSYGINLSFYVDGLSLVFGFLISGIGALVVLYSIFYLSKTRELLHNFYVYMLLFMGAMLGVVFSDNLIGFYLFWELTSISSFLLIAFWYQRKKSRNGAQKAMLITVSGGFSMLAGIVLLHSMAGTYSIRGIISQAGELQEHSLFLPAMIFVLIGAFAKSAQFPFHIWLPDAMEAPTPISAYLHSATMVKAGIYAIARFTPLFGGTGEWFWIITSVGLVTLFWGAVNAMKQTDLKALLAFSTISQLGLITSLLGIGSLALAVTEEAETALYTTAVLAAVFHLVNHSTFKGCLFMVIGIIDHETGTRDTRKLGGLMSLMPISFTLTLIGSLSMAGVPPFNGFLSKELFFTSSLSLEETGIFSAGAAGLLIPAVAWVASIFTFVYSMILIFHTFRGKYRPRRLEKKPKEAPPGMLISPAVLAAFVIGIFFAPNVLAHYVLEPMVASILPGDAGDFSIHIEAWHGFNKELFMTLGVIVLGSILFLTWKRWKGIFTLFPQVYTLNNAYSSGILKAEQAAYSFTNIYMSGLTRDYIQYILGILIILAGGMLLFSEGISFRRIDVSTIEVYEVLLAVGLVAGALTVMLASKRLTAIIAIGAVGYLVALFFVIFRAPDLALTQLVVETVSVALYLLCLRFLPEFRFRETARRVQIPNLIISLGVGVLITSFTLAAQGNKLFPSISVYFEDSYELAGSRNMVNAILADFRGFDTLLEIMVLCIAGLGVYSLISLRMKEKRDDHEN